jgi:hypothetical protein
MASSSAASLRLVQDDALRRVLAVSGSVDRRGVEELGEACRPEQLSAGATVVIDFTAMTGCPSALLLALVRIRDQLGSTRRLQLVGLTEALQSIALGRPPS